MNIIIEQDILLNNLCNKELIIYEDVKGFRINVNFGDEIIIKPNDLSSEPLVLEDESIINFFGKAISHFKNLDDRVKSLLPKKYWFVFEYFTDDIENLPYNRLPKNNLVLTSICKNDKFDYTVDELDEYARLLDVECLPFIFKGILNDKTIEVIKYFLNTNEHDLDYVFGEKSFAYFFYKLLNHSFLMNNDFNSNLEKIIIRTDDDEVTFELLNPLYKIINTENETNYEYVYSLLIMNFLTFCQSINITKIKLKGNKKEEIYMFLICLLYNSYLNDVKKELLDFDFVIPEFFNKEKFRLNKELITNKVTKSFVEEDVKLEYIFKCIYFSLNMLFDENKPFGAFTFKTLKLLNMFIKLIRESIDDYFNKKTERELHKHGLLNYSDFIDIAFDKDGEGNTYPNNSIQKDIINNKKKKPMFFKNEFTVKK